MYYFNMLGISPRLLAYGIQLYLGNILPYFRGKRKQNTKKNRGLEAVKLGFDAFLCLKLHGFNCITSL
jgi:hypothetical protein